MVFKKQTTKEIVEQLLNEKLTEEDYGIIGLLIICFYYKNCKLWFSINYYIK
jgi:hypothetical protein